MQKVIKVNSSTYILNSQMDDEPINENTKCLIEVSQEGHDVVQILRILILYRRTWPKAALPPQAEIRERHDSYQTWPANSEFKVEKWCQL